MGAQCGGLADARAGPRGPSCRGVGAGAGIQDSLDAGEVLPGGPFRGPPAETTSDAGGPPREAVLHGGGGGEGTRYALHQRPRTVGEGPGGGG